MFKQLLFLFKINSITYFTLNTMNYYNLYKYYIDFLLVILYTKKSNILIYKPTIVELFKEFIFYYFYRNYFIINNFTQFINVKTYLIILYKVFMCELIFDFFYYFYHLTLHKNKYLYKYVHKEHHTHENDNKIKYNNMNLIEFIFMRLLLSIPFYILKLNLCNFLIFYIFLITSEVKGHDIKLYNKNRYSFSIIYFIPKLLKIELNVKDHINHHKYINYNYSKKFSIFDKIFGTYKYD